MIAPDPLSGLLLGRWQGTYRGLFVGLLLVVLAFPLILWNEGSTIQATQRVDYRVDQVVSVVIDPVQSVNDGRLVHLTGDLTPVATIVDPELGLSLPVLKLQRQSETYQWIETRRTETEGTYAKAWVNEIVDSRQFRQPDQHRNPVKARFSDWESDSGKARLGSFDLPQDLIDSFNPFEVVRLTPEQLKSLPEAIRKQVRLHEGMLYFGKDPAKPQVGDVRLRYVAVKGGPVSIIGRQLGNTLAPFTTQAGYRIYRLSAGRHKGDEMSREQAPASVVSLSGLMTWALRLFAWAMMATGLLIVLERVGPWTETTPVLRDLVAPGPRTFATVMAAGLVLATVAFAWSSYSWLWAGIFSSLAVTAFVALHRFGQNLRAGPVAR
jgi:hypothetical protein